MIAEGEPYHNLKINPEINLADWLGLKNMTQHARAAQRIYVASNI